MCFKAQNKLVRVAWFSAKFVRANPVVAPILVTLTAAPTGNWKWMSSKKAFIEEATTRIAKNRLREPIAFLVESEVKDR